MIIKQFLSSQNICVLSTASPHSAAVFYAYDDEDNSLIFISNPKSKHISKILSAVIYSEKPIKGVQILGKLSSANKRQKNLFINKFKQAKFALGYEIYALKITYIKYTDNALLLPKKQEFFYE